MNATYTMSGLKVVIEKGIVVASDIPQIQVVGQKPDLKFFKLAGWTKAKANVQHDAFGRKFNADGSVNRK